MLSDDKSKSQTLCTYILRGKRKDGCMHEWMDDRSLKLIHACLVVAHGALVASKGTSEAVTCAT